LRKRGSVRDNQTKHHGRKRSKELHHQIKVPVRLIGFGERWIGPDSRTRSISESPDYISL
jgi:hypothetical protein